MRRLHETWAWRLLWRLRSIPRARSAIARLELPDEPDRPTLLVINHYFDQELKSLRGCTALTDRFHLVALHPWTFFSPNFLWFPPPVWTARRPVDEPGLATARRRSRAHASRLWDALERRFNIAGVVTPSDSFFWAREFFREGQARARPTFVFDKEGTISPASMETETSRIRAQFPPVADRFYVWSERQRGFWERIGVPPSKIRVLGSLRTDLFVRQPPPKERAILFFDFESEAYLNTLTPEERRRTPGDWSELRAELHHVLQAKARQYPHVRFTIKCHPQQPDLAATQKSFRGAGPNCTVLTGSKDVDEIVARHSIAFGFQTTALMEVALSGRPAVYCAWGPLHEAFRPRLVPLMEEGFGIHWCRSPQEFARWIDDHVAGHPAPPPPSRGRLDLFFHDPNGRVAERYATAIAPDLKRPPPGDRPVAATRAA